MLMTKERVLAAIAQAPTIKPVLVRLAKRAADGKPLPETFSATGLDYAAQRELEGLFGIVGKREADGRMSFPLLAGARDLAAWREVAKYFGLTINRIEAHDNPFARAKLLCPEAEEAIDILAQRDEVKRFVSDSNNARDWVRLFCHFVNERLLKDVRDPITLSQLGSDCFGDSKKLRTGALRRQLVHILGIFADHDPSDERGVFGHFGVIANPYTTSVTLFAPIAFITTSGRQFEFPRRLFEEGFACQLPLETVKSIAGIGWDRSERMVVTTSENAAPFARMVEQGIPCIYTEGYPNYCVRRILEGLRIAGVQCVHEGDADLDGFNIAHEIGMAIPVTRLVAAEVLSVVRARFPQTGTPLTDEQRERAKSFLECNPHCAYASEIRRMLSLGRWIEQESFGSILGAGGKRR